MSALTRGAVMVCTLVQLARTAVTGGLPTRKGCCSSALLNAWARCSVNGCKTAWAERSPVQSGDPVNNA